jgi:hypothetical protein
MSIPSQLYRSSSQNDCQKVRYQRAIDPKPFQDLPILKIIIIGSFSAEFDETAQQSSTTPFESVGPDLHLETRIAECPLLENLLNRNGSGFAKRTEKPSASTACTLLVSFDIAGSNDARSGEGKK